MSRDTAVNVRPRSLSVTGTARAWWPPAARVTGSRPSRQPRRCCRRPAPSRWADSWPQGRATCSPMTSERRWSRLTDTRAAGWRTRPAGRSQCCSVAACSACCPCRCYAGCAGSNGNSPTVCRGRTDTQTQRHKMVRRKDPSGKAWSATRRKIKDVNVSDNEDDNDNGDSETQIQLRPVLVKLTVKIYCKFLVK